MEGTTMEGMTREGISSDGPAKIAALTVQLSASLEGTHTTLSPSVAQPRTCSDVQDSGTSTYPQDESEQHKFESNMPWAIIDDGDIPTLVRLSEPKGIATPPNTIVCVHAPSWDHPHGELLIVVSPPIMQTVPTGVLQQPAPAEKSDSQGP